MTLTSTAPPTPITTTAAVRIGPLEIWPPVVLAPMAGVTNAPFRTMCRTQGAGLYVSEMITARALVMNNEKTNKLAEFGPDEHPRSIQLYGIEPTSVGEAVRRLVDEGRVDHVDLNFGCPAPKVTRHGGGAALPVRRRLLTSIIAAAVAAAGAVPVTAKFRMGTDDDHMTYLDTGRIAEAEGCAAVALHARTAEQLYSGEARWAAIGTLKEAVASIPVLGNGDIWEAEDAVAMMTATGCDGVVIGRGCLGRPWLFADLAARFEGAALPPTPRLGQVAALMATHLRLLEEWFGTDTPQRNGAPPRAIRDFRKHTGWYLKGYPVGPEVRATLAQLSSAQHLDDVLGALDPELALTSEGRRAKRGHQNGPRVVSLPDHWYELADSDEAIDAAAESATSGG